MPLDLSDNFVITKWYGPEAAADYFGGKGTSAFKPVDKIKARWGSFAAFLKECRDDPDRAEEIVEEIKAAVDGKEDGWNAIHTAILRRLLQMGILYVTDKRVKTHILKGFAQDLLAQKEIPSERLQKRPDASPMVTRSHVRVKEEPMDDVLLPLAPEEPRVEDSKINEASPSKRKSAEENPSPYKKQKIILKLSRNAQSNAREVECIIIDDDTPPPESSPTRTPSKQTRQAKPRVPKQEPAASPPPSFPPLPVNHNPNHMPYSHYHTQPQPNAIPQHVVDLYMHTLRTYGRVEAYLEEFTGGVHPLRDDPMYTKAHEAIQRAIRLCESDERRRDEFRKAAGVAAQ